MTFKGIKYSFSAAPWQYTGPAGWYFVTIPKHFSDEIRQAFKSEEEGWGRLRAQAQIGASEWKTAIWFDTKLECYSLPLKAEIRKAEHIVVDEPIHVTVWI